MDSRQLDDPLSSLGRIDLSSPIEQIDWLIHPYIARSRFTLLAGREGEGKSLYSQHLALRLAEQGYKVMIVDVENGPALIHERLHKLSAVPGVEGIDPLVTNRISVFAPESFDLADTDSAMPAFMALQHAMQMEEPDVVILDSLKSMWSGGTTSNKISRIINVLRELARRAECGIVMLHHTTKSGNTYVGSQAIGASCDMVYFFLRERDDPESGRRVIRCYKNRLGAEPQDDWVQISAEANGKLLAFDPAEPFIPPIQGSARNMLTTKIMYVLLHSDTPLNLADLARKVGRNPKDATVRRVLSSLIGDGTIVKTSRGSYVIPKNVRDLEVSVTAAANTDSD